MKNNHKNVLKILSRSFIKFKKMIYYINNYKRV